MSMRRTPAWEEEGLGSIDLRHLYALVMPKNLFSWLVGDQVPTDLSPLLFEAADLGSPFSITLIDLLLEHGVDVNAKNRERRTPLHRACWITKNTSIARYLVKRGADVNAGMGVGLVPLEIASEYNCEERIRLLLDHGADVNGVMRGSRTPLHWACNRGDNAKVVRLLLDHGADVNVVDIADTPLDLACEQADNADVIHMLLDHGGRVTPRLIRTAHVSNRDFLQRYASAVRIQRWYRHIRARWFWVGLARGWYWRPGGPGYELVRGRFEEGRG